MKNQPYRIANRERVDAYLYHSVVSTDCGGENQHFCNDRVLFLIPDIADYDTDLIQDGDLILSFSKSDALRLARKLISMAHKLKTAEEREAEGLNGIPILPPELEKAWR